MIIPPHGGFGPPASENVIVTGQLSVAVAVPVLAGAVLAPQAIVVFAGQEVNTGGVKSAVIPTVTQVETAQLYASTILTQYDPGNNPVIVGWAKEVYPPGPVHEYTYGGVPPTMEAVAVPVAPPQFAGVAEARNDTLQGGGTVILKVRTEVAGVGQLLSCALMDTVYV